MAVCTNILSPHTSGVDVPSPGIFAFHFTWLLSLHVVGGLASGATPEASGPRHCGQFSPAEPLKTPVSDATNGIARGNCFMRLRNVAPWTEKEKANVPNDPSGLFRDR